jgi:hypothetical protein
MAEASETMILHKPAPLKYGDPEHLMGMFNDYVKRFELFLLTTGVGGIHTAGHVAEEDRRQCRGCVRSKAALQLVGGKEMITLFEHTGMVEDRDSYTAAVAKIRVGIKKAELERSSMVEDYISECLGWLEGGRQIKKAELAVERSFMVEASISNGLGRSEGDRQIKKAELAVERSFMVEASISNGQSPGPAHEKVDGAHEEVDGSPGHKEVDGSPAHEKVDGSPALEEVDGSPAHEKVDGSPAHEKVDGSPAHEEVDGSPAHKEVDGSDVVDGSPAHGKVDGSPAHEEVDGSPAYDEAKRGQEAKIEAEVIANSWLAELDNWLEERPDPEPDERAGRPVVFQCLGRAEGDQQIKKGLGWAKVYSHLRPHRRKKRRKAALGQEEQ